MDISDFLDILKAIFNFLSGCVDWAFETTTGFLFDFFSAHISDFKSFGVKVIGFFDIIPLGSDALSFDFVYFFIGAIAFVFFFKLVFSLLSSLISDILKISNLIP